MYNEGIFLRQKIELVIAVVFFLSLIFISQNINKQVASVQVEEKKQLIVLDSGHGGSDPGKVGINGALEKDINLSIAELVKERLEQDGIEVIMVRGKDEMLSSDGADNKKLEDMKARVEIINRNLPDIAVSIHQNSYEDAGVSGAQVFYFVGSIEGQKAAEIMQKALLEVDESNTRQAKENNSYYLLKRTEVPTIIVECGFLSNQQEAELLVTEDYQTKLADAICEGIKGYLEAK